MLELMSASIFNLHIYDQHELQLILRYATFVIAAAQLRGA